MEVCIIHIYITNGSKCKTYQKGKLPLLFDDVDEHNGEITMSVGGEDES